MRKATANSAELQPYQPPQAMEYGSIRHLTQGDY